jgi:diguanylate cyclase (GGDEF)-like protein
MNTGSPERLTTLPRLGAGEPALRAMVEAAVINETPLMLFYLDLDHFRSINDNMGVEIGDQALALVGQRLQQLVGLGGRVWMHGSDEFLVAVPRSHSALSPEAYGQHLRERVELPMTLLPYTLVLTATVGVALCPDHGQTATALLQSAEHAVEQARFDGMNLVRVYQPGIKIG